MELITPDWPAPANIKAFATTRDGGVSQGKYSSLNLGDHVADDPSNVNQNCELLTAKLQLPSAPLWLQQQHTNIVVDANEVSATTIADASYANASNKVCIIMTADCLPVLICNQQGTEVAAIHAGWRSLAANIIQKTIAKFKTPNKQLIAWLGPAISQNNYEVGPEVQQAFTSHHPEDTKAFIPSKKPNHYLACLNSLARNHLNLLNLSNIHGGTHCTYSDATKFFSYRRDNQTGRQASLIWISHQLEK